MPNIKSYDWREIGWNGIRFMAPKNWEPGRIGNSYLLLENQKSPSIELKWNRVKGKFDPERHLKRLATEYRKNTGQRIAEWKLPGKIKEVVSHFETLGFQWRGEKIAGKGLVLFCPECRSATLIQFYENPDIGDTKGDIESKTFILESFRDHTESETALWSLFDIRAVLPNSYKMIRYSFSPGSYQLSFQAGGNKVFLHRWGPASVLLTKTDLMGFAHKAFSFRAKPAKWITRDNLLTIELESILPGSIWNRWARRMRRKPVFQWARLWHLPEKNKLLAVHAENAKPLNIGVLKSMCKKFDAV